MNYFILIKSKRFARYFISCAFICLVSIFLQAMDEEITSNFSNENDMPSIESGMDIMQSIESNNIAALRVLLANGHNPNKIIKKTNPLLAAIFQKNEDMVALLLRFGAEAVKEVKENDGSSITFAAFLERYATDSIKQMLENHFNQNRQQKDILSKNSYQQLHSKLISPIFSVGIIFIIFVSLYQRTNQGFRK